MPCEHKTRRPNAEESAALAELAEREQALAAEEQALEDSYAEAGDEWERIGLEQQDIEARRKAIQIGLRTWSESDRRRTGVIVTIDRTGDLEVIQGLLRQEDQKAQAKHRAVGASSEGADEDRAGADLVERGGTGTGRSEARPAQMPESLSRRLAEHRTMALQASLLQNGRKRGLKALLTGVLAGQMSTTCRSNEKPTLQVVPSPGSMLAVR